MQTLDTVCFKTKKNPLQKDRKVQGTQFVTEAHFMGSDLNLQENKVVLLTKMLMQ